MLASSSACPLAKPLATMDETPKQNPLDPNEDFFKKTGDEKADQEPREGKPEEPAQVYEFQLDPKPAGQDMKSRLIELAKAEIINGNRNLLIGFGGVLLLTLLSTWPHLERKIDQTPSLYAYAVEHQNDTTRRPQRQLEQEAIPIVDEDEREKRIQELERAREKRVKAARAKTRTSDALEDSLETLETADVDVESFGTATYSHELGEGETLENLAQRFNLSPDSLRAANPGLEEAEKGSVVDVPLRAIHTMKSGQTLTKISKIYLVDKDLIRRANQMRNDYLAVGQSVFIPKP